MNVIHTKMVTSYKWSFLLLCLFAFHSQAEVINNFEAAYTIMDDGSVIVRETIQYNFEDASRHGIFRTLKTDHPQEATKKWHDRVIDIEVNAVEQDSREGLYEVTTADGELTIKIGDPDEYVTGVHEYSIEYVLRGALSYGSEGAEFYYNVTGNGWDVPITNATARVLGESKGVLAPTSYCYQGPVGSQEECTKLQGTATETIFIANDLGAGEGLTVAQEIDAGEVAALIINKANIEWVLWVVAGLWLTGLSVWAWRFKYRHTIERPVIAQYEPYADFLPMYTGVLFDNSLDPHDITAGVVYLAEQGFISIKRTNEKVLWIFNTTDYELTLKRPLSEIPTTFLQSLSGLLFSSTATVGTSVPLSSLAKKPQENSKLISSLQTSLKQDLESNGFIESTYKEAFFTFIKAAVFVWGITFIAFNILSPWSPAFILPFVVAAALSVAILVFVMIGRRTVKGYEARNHLEGFKLFLSVTDKERFAFHNAPAKSPEVFMKYLPYAIALKVGKEWAKVFEGISIPNPGWYDGGNLGAFSAAAFTSDMKAFSTAFSSSSGTSGSSGGGSSGGGGGGGGGGSW